MRNSKIEIIEIIERITDIAIMFITNAIANKIRFGLFRTGIINPNNSYLTIFGLTVIAYFITTFLIHENKSFIERSLFDEIVAVVRKHIYMIGIVTLFLYLSKTGDLYSRVQMGLFFSINAVCIIIERKVLKRIFTKNYHRSQANERILLITTSDKVKSLVKKIKETRNWYFRISYIAVVDTDMIGEIVNNIDITANKDNLINTIATSSIDSVLICTDEYRNTEFIETVCDMGKKVHIEIEDCTLADNPHHLDMLGNVEVVTYADSVFSIQQLFIKRLVDVMIGALGTILLVFVSVFVEICRFLENDKGHSILAYTRVRKNGRDFKMYRFRTMYRYSDKRSSKYSITGRIIRFFRIENLPQVWNVLWGEMSVVGPKPMTFDDFMNLPHNSRKIVRMKPGVIGYWNTINKTIENNTIDSDLVYAKDWNIKLDLFLIVEFFHHLLLKFNDNYDEFEHQLLKDYEANEAPYHFEHNYSSKKNYMYLFIKRAFDIVASFMGIIVLMPIYLVFGLLVHWEDGGSPIYGHTRIGYRGKKVKILKFRSMKMQLRDLEKILTPEQLEQYRTEFKIDNDPRITKIGNILRKTSVDELPQLFNILKGDISVVGPRPIVEKELEMYYKGEEDKLLSVKPGLTGYWQAYARNNATYESGERQKMEMYYVKNASLWLDIKILFRTVYAVLKRDGAQ